MIKIKAEIDENGINSKPIGQQAMSGFQTTVALTKAKKSVSPKGSILSWTNEKADVLVLHTWFPN
jgi:hypothetical protein